MFVGCGKFPQRENRNLPGAGCFRGTQTKVCRVREISAALEQEFVERGMAPGGTNRNLAGAGCFRDPRTEICEARNSLARALLSRG